MWYALEHCLLTMSLTTSLTSWTLTRVATLQFIVGNTENTPLTIAAPTPAEGEEAVIPAAVHNARYRKVCRFAWVSAKVAARHVTNPHSKPTVACPFHSTASRRRLSLRDEGSSGPRAVRACFVHFFLFFFSLCE